ncbi:MAG: hypothetical protein PVI86_10700 [Phycisphaerae bacterium]
MSILTKVFIVLLVICSIAFTSMTVAIVAQTPNWRDLSEKYEERARVADTALRHEIAANAALIASLRDDVQSKLERIGELETDLQAARNEAAQLRAEVAKAAAERSSAEAMNRGLFAQLQATEQARSEYLKQRDALERTQIDLQQRNIDLSDRVNELTTQVEVQLEQKRHYEQQINMLRSDVERLSQATRIPSRALAMEAPEAAAMSGVTPMTPVASRTIRGKVLEVAGALVRISVGSADGVKKDMVFVVHRDGQYVGDVRVNLVDPNQSAGRMVRGNQTPQAGDDITDALGLEGSAG